MKRDIEDLRLDPKCRIAPKFDEYSIGMYRLPEPDEMGVRVVDNCAEEHIM